MAEPHQNPGLLEADNQDPTATAEHTGNSPSEQEPKLDAQNWAPRTIEI